MAISCGNVGVGRMSQEIATPLRARNDVVIWGWSCCFFCGGHRGIFTAPLGRRDVEGAVPYGTLGSLM